MEIKVAPKGTKPLKSDYDLGSSPSGYVVGERLCEFHRSIEWKIMVKLGLEIEYMTLILTHEQALHETAWDIYWRYQRKRRRSVWKERLVHKSDICVFLGY